MPLFTEEEILTLLRTPCNSPTIERVSNYSTADVNSIISDALSSIGVVSSSDEHEEQQTVEETNFINDLSIDGDDSRAVVNFKIGSDSSSASIRSSVYSKYSSTIVEKLHPKTTTTIIEQPQTPTTATDETLLEHFSPTDDDVKIIEREIKDLDENSVVEDSTLDSRDKLRVDDADATMRM